MGGPCEDLVTDNTTTQKPLHILRKEKTNFQGLSHWIRLANDNKACINARLKQKIKALSNATMPLSPYDLKSSKLESSTHNVAWGGAEDTLVQKQLA